MAAAPVLAQEVADAPTGPLRWSGFGTLGLTHHDNDQAGAIAAFSQTAPAWSGWSGNLDSVLGLQLDARLLDTTSATVQGVVRAGDDFRPRARMAYLRQQLGQDAALRLGRIRSPLYLDSDVTEIGFAYPTVRPALPVYNVAANNVPHIDGGDVQWRHSFGSMAMLVQGYFGGSAYQHVFYNTDPRIKADAELHGVRGLAVSFSLPEVTLRVSHTRVDRYTMRSAQIDQINAGLAQMAAGLQGIAATPGLPDAVRTALGSKAAAVQGYSNPFDNRPLYTSVGFDANLQKWRLMGEWTLFDSRSAMVGKYRGYQGTLGYTLGDVTPYLTGSRNDRQGGGFDTGALGPTGLNPALDAGLQQLQGALDQAASFADLSTRSAGLGMRWEARDNLAVKLQYERLWTPSSTTPGVFAVPGLPFRRSINLLSATLDFVF
ncbi:MAG: hypothetical protein AB9M60_12905 [Leptothrix sp. (in: b-proteobacteria)]